jgi:hypothetical protein
VRAGTPGHIEARTRGRILTYLGGEEQYAKQLSGGWWRMGDVGYRTRWGGLYLIDREIDQIDSVDSNLEIEDILMSRLAELREIVVVPAWTASRSRWSAPRNDEPLDPQRWQEAVAGLPDDGRAGGVPLRGPAPHRHLEDQAGGDRPLLRESQSLSRNWIAS